MWLKQPTHPAEARPEPPAGVFRRHPDRNFWIFFVLAMLALAASGFFLLRHFDERQSAQELASREIERERDAERILSAAIAQGIAITGMMGHDVIQAKGHPTNTQLGPDVPQNLRALGVVQVWIYDRYDGDPVVRVCFNRDGMVIAANDKEFRR